MRAMTEIPANTPRPIGRTESLVPGSWNLAVLLSAVSAAEVALAAVSPTTVPDARLSVATTDVAIDEKPWVPLNILFHGKK